MMKKIEDLTFYELLEVSPSATSQEIHKAYERTRRVYDPSSIALYSLFSPEETAAIQQRIEEAYRTLMYESHRKKYDEQLKSMQALSDEPGRSPEFADRSSADLFGGFGQGQTGLRQQEPPPGTAETDRAGNPAPSGL